MQCTQTPIRRSHSRILAHHRRAIAPCIRHKRGGGSSWGGGVGWRNVDDHDDADDYSHMCLHRLYTYERLSSTSLE